MKGFDYTGWHRYFVTICTDRKREVFANDEVVNLCLNVLKEVSHQYHFEVWVYSFMPDHLHILPEGKNEDSNLRRFISVFKQRSSFGFLRNCELRCSHYKTAKLWQENYYERVLRKDEDTTEVARYILNNPVRRGLVQHYLQYPYSGSLVINIKNL